MLETDIEKRFVAYAESLDCRALKLRIDGRNGWPDRTVTTPEGRTLFIEFKTPKGRLSRSQQEWIHELRDLGYTVEVCTSFKQAKQALDQFIKED